VAAAGCGQSSDPYCNDPNPLPVASQLLVTLFDSEGRHVCVTPTRIMGAQPAAQRPVSTTEFMFVEMGYADLDTRARIVERPGPGCNLWVSSVLLGPDLRDKWETCGAPIHVEVEVPGCEPSHVDMTWEDNTYPGRLGINWYVPAIMNCDEGVAATEWPPP
jgi:hypothetical protein